MSNAEQIIAEMQIERKAVKTFMERGKPYLGGACGCMGPQGDEPWCPCEMRWMVKVDDAWFRITEQIVDSWGYKYIATRTEVPTWHEDAKEQPPMTLKEKLRHSLANKHRPTLPELKPQHPAYMEIK
jgi:hypothetical protein